MICRHGYAYHSMAQSWSVKHASPQYLGKRHSDAEKKQDYSFTIGKLRIFGKKGRS